MLVINTGDVSSNRSSRRINSAGGFEDQADSVPTPFALMPGEHVTDYTELTDLGIYATNYRLFVSLSPGFFNLPLACIDAVEVRDLFFLYVHSKDGRTVR
jgi:hypothetical protein